MIRNKEQLIQEKTDKIAQQVKVYVEEMNTLSEGNAFTIDMIEKKWEELDQFTRQIYREINDEIVRQLDEKQMIALKKENTQGKG